MKLKRLRVFYCSRILGIDYFTPFPFLLARILRFFYAVSYLYISGANDYDKIYEWWPKEDTDHDDN